MAKAPQMQTMDAGDDDTPNAFGQKKSKGKGAPKFGSKSKGKSSRKAGGQAFKNAMKG